MIENYNNQINLLRAFGNQKYQQLNFVYSSEPIKHFFTFVKGKEVGSKNYLSENSKQAIPYLRVSNLLSGQYDTFVEDAEIVANNDDILIALDGAPGRNNIGLHGAYSSGIYKVVSSEIYKGIIYFYLNSEYCQNVIKVNSQGTTILHAGKAIKELFFPQEISEACLDEFNLIFRQIIDLIEKRNILLEQKKLLLAKYFE